MLHTEIVCKLYEQTREEALYADYQNVLAGMIPFPVWKEKWKDDANRIDFVLHPDRMETLLTEDRYIPEGMDIFIDKAPRFAPVFMHRHTFYEMIYVFHGACRISFREEESDLNLTTGSFLIIAPEYNHLIEIANENTIVLNIIIRSSAFWSIWQNTLRRNTPVSRFFRSHMFGRNGIPYILFDIGSSTDIQYYILESLNEQIEPDEYSNIAKINYLNMIFLLLCRHPSAKTTFSDYGSDKSSRISTKVIGYMLNNYRTCTLESLADHMHYTAQYCSKIIKESTGSSYSEILTEIRTQKAAELLLSTPMKIAAISEYVGYSNPETLIRAFKNQFHVTPAEYRKKGI